MLFQSSINHSIQCTLDMTSLLKYYSLYDYNKTVVLLIGHLGTLIVCGSIFVKFVTIIISLPY